jgi:hypothetical protein
VSYLVHYLLELVGQGVLILAYKHVCRTRWHRIAIWQAGTILTTVITVHAVG